MDLKLYTKIKAYVLDAGFSWEILEVEQVLKFPCSSKEVFLKQYIWVIVNAGLKYQVGVQIFYRILFALHFQKPLEMAFNNKKKTDAIYFVINNLTAIFHNYKNAQDKISFLEKLPFIGPTTKYHLARNLGHNICKPDRHLVRISESYHITPNELCSSVSEISGDPIGVVDVILWRAANLGFI
jgi:hypothetical protein